MYTMTKRESQEIAAELGVSVLQCQHSSGQAKKLLLEFGQMLAAGCLPCWQGHCCTAVCTCSSAASLHSTSSAAGQAGAAGPGSRV